MRNSCGGKRFGTLPEAFKVVTWNGHWAWTRSSSHKPQHIMRGLRYVSSPYAQPRNLSPCDSLLSCTTQNNYQLE